ncbi:hypothetical protein NQ318_004385 [Aromia moschata]|uniref:GST N-terminal domain-containing protein n=1 Tax=Aromia moschata TaxID=1265417 RepID=A0AAV8YTA4_9CUCU|nr:hypothetical protein NQ318_004385 [Aromia moschata]
MAPKLYYTPGSPPAMASLLTVKALGIQVDLKPVNLLAGEHLTPEFQKMNPLRTVPTLVDGDFTIWDSHAINAYLTGKYGKDDALYTKDLQKRAVVDQRMYFDCGITRLWRPFWKEARTSLGEHVTLADFSVVTSVTAMDILVPIDAQKFPKITGWIKKMQALPYYAEANQVGLDALKRVIESKLKA